MEIETKKIPIAKILIDDDFNCRGKMLPMHVVDLMQDIDRDGLLQPVLVTPIEHPEYDYKLVAGFRRTFACRLLKKTEIMAVIHSGISDMKAVSMNLRENIQRQQLNILQEAKSIKKMRELGMTEADTAKEINMSRGWVQIRFMLLSFPESIQEMAAAGLINNVQIRELYKERDPAKQIEAARQIKLDREKGERAPKVKKKVTNLQVKKERKRAEIFHIQSFIIDSIGGNIGTRALAWCAGEISTEDLLKDFENYAKKNDKFFNPRSYEVDTAKI